MPFTVAWTKNAEAGLACLYNKAPQSLRQSVTQASDQIDLRLRFAGDQLGTPLPGIRGGLVYAEPVNADWLLAVVFDFSPDDKLLTIHKPLLIPQPK